MRHTCKALMAMAAGIALVILGAVPSAANAGTVTGGTITINTTPVWTWTLGDAGCASSLSIDLANHNASSTSTGTAALTLVSPIAWSGVDYVFVATITGVGVSLTHTTTSVQNIATSAFTITNVNVYPSAGPGSCTIDGTARCGDVNMAFTGGLTGTFTGTIASTAPHDLSGTAHLTGVGAISSAGCVPPFSNLNGKTGTIGSLTVAF